MRRLLVLGLAFVTACSGGGGGRYTPTGAPATAMRQQSSGHGHGHGHARASLTLLIPKQRHRGRGRHAATISPSTQSITIAVNGGSATFNTSPSSPGCTGGGSGTVCTLQLAVPYGSDTFVVSTYSGKNAGGFMLDQASIDVDVSTDTAQVAITLGPVFSNPATPSSSSGRPLRRSSSPAAGSNSRRTCTSPARVLRIYRLPETGRSNSCWSTPA
jgi:hypothetical protein